MSKKNDKKDEPTLKNDLVLMDDSEFMSKFDLKPVDPEAFYRSIGKIKANKNGVAVTVENVKAVRVVKQKDGKEKAKLNFDLRLHEPLKKALGKPIVTKNVKNKQGQMVERTVYDKDEFGEFDWLKLKDYDEPIHFSLNLGLPKERKIESSDEFPDGVALLYPVNPNSSAFPLLNFLAKADGLVKEDNKQGFMVGQKTINNLEGLEVLANYEKVELEGLKPFLRLTVSDLDFDFDEEDDEDFKDDEE